MKVAKIDPTQVKGWGMDADAQNDPTYPMKKRNDGEHAGYTWERPPQQPVNVELLHSIERNDYTATFGTSSPPSGLSGVLRRFAFKYSESNYGHWLPLMLADRVNVVEAILRDIGKFKLPNFFRELGWAAEWKHNRKDLIIRNVVRVVIVAALVGLFRRKKDESDW